MNRLSYQKYYKQIINHLEPKKIELQTYRIRQLMNSKTCKQQEDSNLEFSTSSLDITIGITQTQQKQQYLRQQILDKNFNPEDFIQYMNQKLHIESDITKCSLIDLKKVVQSYIAKVKKDEIHMSQFDQIEQNSLRNSMISVETLPPLVVVKLNAQPLIEEDQFKEVVRCCQIDEKYNQNEWKSKKVYCAVHSPQRKFVSSFLGVSTSSYLEFKVKTFGLGWEVGRRYSDFIWLRNTLKRFYPSQIIPPIPNKKAHKRLPRQLQKRMKILSLFLNDLFTYPQFINSKYIEGFLSYQDSKFISFKKQIDSKKSFQTIKTTQTLTGLVNVELNKQIFAYNKELERWVDESEVMLKNLTRSSKSLQRGIIEQVNTLYDMGDQLAGLHTASLSISKLENRSDSGFFRLKDIFVTLNNMVIQWGSILKSQIEIIQTNCNIVYKYVRQSLFGIREIITKKKQHQVKYFQTKIELNALKEKIFTLHDVQKWDIPKTELTYIPKSAIYQKREAFSLMLPKQSSALWALKMNYCYYLTRIYQNADKFLKMKAQLLCSAMEQFTIRQKVNNQQVGEMWNEMSFNFTHAFQVGKNKKKLWVKTQEKIKNQQLQMENYENSSVDLP